MSLGYRNEQHDILSIVCHNEHHNERVIRQDWGGERGARIVSLSYRMYSAVYLLITHKYMGTSQGGHYVTERVTLEPSPSIKSFQVGREAGSRDWLANVRIGS